MRSPATFLALLLVAVPGVVTSASGFPRLSFEPQRIQRTEPDCSPDAGRRCAHVILSGLQVQEPTGPAALAVQRQLDRALAGEEGDRQSPRALAASFLAESQRSRGSGARAAWFLERRVRLLSQRPRLLSFAIESERFTGGAHPSRDVRFLNLDPETGSPTTLADLLVPGGAERLTVIARQQMRQTGVLRAALDAAAAAGSSPDGELGLPASIGVTDDALLLAYDAYEVAPYAAGPLSIEIKLAGIRALLRADGPLAGDRPAGPTG